MDHLAHCQGSCKSSLQTCGALHQSSCVFVHWNRNYVLWTVQCTACAFCVTFLQSPSVRLALQSMLLDFVGIIILRCIVWWIRVPSLTGQTWSCFGEGGSSEFLSLYSFLTLCQGEINLHTYSWEFPKQGYMILWEKHCTSCVILVITLIPTESSFGNLIRNLKMNLPKHLGTSQYSHLLLESVVKHQGPSGSLLGFLQKFSEIDVVQRVSKGKLCVVFFTAALHNDVCGAISIFGTKQEEHTLQSLFVHLGKVIIQKCSVRWIFVPSLTCSPRSSFGEGGTSELCTYHTVLTFCQRENTLNHQQNVFGSPGWGKLPFALFCKRGIIFCEHSPLHVGTRQYSHLLLGSVV